MHTPLLKNILFIICSVFATLAVDQFAFFCIRLVTCGLRYVQPHVTSRLVIFCENKPPAIYCEIPAIEICKIFLFPRFRERVRTDRWSAIIAYIRLSHIRLFHHRMRLVHAFTRTFDEGRKKRDLGGASCGSVPPFFSLFFFFVTGDLCTRRWQCTAILVTVVFSLSRKENEGL